MLRFEKQFRRKFPGTYYQYNKLPPWKQSQLYEEYRKTGDMAKFRQQVLSTLSGS